MSTWDSGFDAKALPSNRAWNIVDPKKQSDMKHLSRFVPGGGFVMMLMTREGVADRPMRWLISCASWTV